MSQGFTEHTHRLLACAQSELRLVPLAASLTHLSAWQRFMELHVYAVWDFMSLVKRLQREITPSTLPWQPPASRQAARFIQEIVLAEECDVDGQGGFCSHFELYSRAMADAGADVAPIEATLEALRGGMGIADAMRRSAVPAAVRDFVTYTIELAQSGSLPEVAAAFLYGREATLPTLFADLLAAVEIGEPRLAALSQYFSRHIEIDGDQHGPMAVKLLESICGVDPIAWHAAQQSALQSLTLRKKMWIAIRDEILALKPCIAPTEEATRVLARH